MARVPPLVLAGLLATSAAAARAAEPESEPAPEPAPAGQDEEDDPAFARRKAAAPAPLDVFEEEPFPELDGDPAPDVGSPTTVRRRALRRGAADLEGARLRVGYRTFGLVELADTDQTLRDSRFHALSLDVYPISWFVRLGLSTQVALETEEDDWLATEGLVVGIQRPGGRWTPYAEGGVHVGLGRRTVLYPFADQPESQLTMLWSFAAEIGVDGRFAGAAMATFAVGVQRMSYFTTMGDLMDPLTIASDTALTLKIGIGY